MAWNPFGRRTSSGKMPGSLDEIDDYSLKEQSKTIADVEGKAQKVSKSMKKVAETRENLAKATERLLAELAESPTCNFDTDLRLIGELGSAILPKLKESTESSNKVLLKTVRAALKTYRKNLQSLQAAVKKHDNLTAEMHQLQAKTKKYETREMSNANAHKLEIAKRDVETLRSEHSQSLASLRKELPEFLAYRSQVIGPCLQLLACAEHEYFTETDRMLAECLTQVTSRTASLGQATGGADLIDVDDADTNLSAEERSLLDEIKSLSIVIED